MERDDEPETGRPGALLFALLFLALSLSLLSQLGNEAKFSAKGNWVAQPAFWPAIGVIGMSVFGALHLLTQHRREGFAGSLGEAAVWLLSLEYFAWFMAYVFVVPVIGYLPATLIFTTALALRAGYRDGWMLGAAALTGLGVVLVFKTLLSVKIPGGALYEYFPAAMRSFLMTNF
ncbi:MAG: tripartite tricarboxylate transporter TctB family protein [Alphaproteobacteria bacterium]|nr:tripartite tricarboxylate transporter TctB family protein [Alphaproteobacteria bacterium]